MEGPTQTVLPLSPCRDTSASLQADPFWSSADWVPSAEFWHPSSLNPCQRSTLMNAFSRPFMLTQYDAMSHLSWVVPGGGWHRICHHRFHDGTHGTGCLDTPVLYREGQPANAIIIGLVQGSATQGPPKYDSPCPRLVSKRVVGGRWRQGAKEVLLSSCISLCVTPLGFRNREKWEMCFFQCASSNGCTRQLLFHVLFKLGYRTCCVYCAAQVVPTSARVRLCC